MNDCPDCAIAEQNPFTGHFSAECIDCQARAIAQGPQAHARAAEPTDLQVAMRNIWHEVEVYKRGRVLVWNWILKIEAAKLIKKLEAAKETT